MTDPDTEYATVRALVREYAIPEREANRLLSSLGDRDE
jgi:hypothetical protein